MKKIILFAFVALVALTGCENKQSELTIDSLGGSATLTGSVFYAPGYFTIKTNTDIEPLEAVPAANQKLLVVVPNSSYLEVKGEPSNRTYETTIAKDGSFSITIPVPVTKNLSGYKFEIRPFTADYKFPDYDYSSKKYSIVEKIAYFDKISGLSTSNNLKNGNTYYVGKVTLNYSNFIE